MRKGSLVRFALTLVIALLTVTVLAQHASADIVKVTPCASPAESFEFLFSDPRFGWFSGQANCPEFSIGVNDTPELPVPDGERGAGVMLVRDNLVGVDVTIAGAPPADSGVSVRLSVCNYDECGRPVDSTDSPTPFSDQLSLADGIPAQPVTVLFEAFCHKSGGCGELSPVVFKDLKLSYSDESDPEVALIDDNGNSLPDVSPWLGQNEFVNVRASESETFIATVSTSLGEVFLDSCERLDDDSFVPWCAPGVAQGFVHLPDDFEGSAPLTVSVTDGAGHPASASMTVRRDTVAPPAPTDLTVGANGAGWINRPEFTASWTNNGETAETDSESGIAAAEYTLFDGSMNKLAAGTRSGESIDSFTSTVNVPGTYTLEVRVRDAAGNLSDPAQVTFSYDSIKPVAAGVSNLQTVNADHTGPLDASWVNVVYHQPWFSGICGYLAAFNSIEHFDPISGPGVVELPADAVSYSIPEDTLSDLADGPRYFHLRAVSCAGTLGDTADRPVIIDRLRPKLSTDPSSDGWIPQGGRLEISADDSDPGNPLAGISQLSYRLDTNPWVTVYKSSAQLTIPQHMHKVQFVAVDFAGNISESEIRVGVDNQIPTAAFDAFDSQDPTLVRGHVTDSDSGVDDAWVEYSPPDSAYWARLPGELTGAGERVVTARIPDDESLPPGEYKLRIVARDNAGNTAVVSTGADGESMSVHLPLRPHPKLTISLASPGDNPVSSLTVPFGSVIQAQGVLRDASGNPVGGAPIAISQSVSGGPPRQIATVTTDAQGAYLAGIPAGPSRSLTARYFGDVLHGSASASSTFNVRGKVTLKKLPKRVRSGKRFYFRGTVDPGSAPLPRAGARVLIQTRDGRRWSGMALSDRTASDGSFEIGWNYRARGRAIRFVFRAVVDTESGWPYALGYSKSRSVVVR